MYNWKSEKIKKLLPDAVIEKYLSGDELIASGCEPDILFLDIQMPGMDGMETARILRQKNEKMVLIFVTAVEEYVFQAFDVAAFHYLVKPFSDEKFTHFQSGNFCDRISLVRLLERSRQQGVFRNRLRRHARVNAGAP